MQGIWTGGFEGKRDRYVCRPGTVTYRIWLGGEDDVVVVIEEGTPTPHFITEYSSSDIRQDQGGNTDLGLNATCGPLVKSLATELNTTRIRGRISCRPLLHSKG